MKIFRFTLFVLLLSALSCTSKKNLNINTNMSDLNPKEIEKLVYADLPYNQLKINGSAVVDIPGKLIPKVKLTIYNEHNEKIWINGQVALMNVGRAMAVPSKFEGYEKITKSYVDESYNYINDLLGVNFINYESLERLLLGRVFSPIDFKKSSITTDGEDVVVKVNEPLQVEVDGKMYKYEQELRFDSRFNLKQIEVEDKDNNKHLTVTYEERENFNNLNLPKLTKILLKDTKERKITLEYSNFSQEKMDANFSIPSNYTKREIK